MQWLVKVIGNLYQIFEISVCTWYWTAHLSLDKPHSGTLCGWRLPVLGSPWLNAAKFFNWNLLRKTQSAFLSSPQSENTYFGPLCAAFPPANSNYREMIGLAITTSSAVSYQSWQLARPTHSALKMIVWSILPNFSTAVSMISFLSEKLSGILQNQSDF